MSTERLPRPSATVPKHHNDPQLTLTVVRGGPLTEIDVKGFIDLSTAHLLTLTVEQVMAAYSPHCLILDLARVRLLCAAGVAALLQAQDAVTGQAGRLILRNPSPMAYKVLDITDTARHFAINASPGSAPDPALLPQR